MLGNLQTWAHYFGQGEKGLWCGILIVGLLILVKTLRGNRCLTWFLFSFFLAFFLSLTLSHFGMCHSSLAGGGLFFGFFHECVLWFRFLACIIKQLCLVGSLWKIWVREGFYLTISCTLPSPSPRLSRILWEKIFTDAIKTLRKQQGGRSKKKMGSTEHPVSVWRQAERAGHS